MTKMNTRQTVIILYVAVFLSCFMAVLSGLAEKWHYLQAWEAMFFGVFILTSFCGVLIALWSYEDKEQIEYLTLRIKHLRDKIDEVEQKTS